MIVVAGSYFALNQVERMAPVLDELERTAGFWIAPSLRARVLQLARE